MRVLELDDAAEFLRAAGPLLLPNEARENLIFGIAGSIVSDPGRYPEARFWLVTDGDEPVSAAMRTPPFNLVLAKPRDDGALAALAAGITEELPGIVGGRPEVDRFVRLWSERHEITARIQRRQGVYALETVQPLPPAPGEARTAIQDDRPLLLEWSRAFAEEALEEDDPGRVEAVAMVDHRLGARRRRLPALGGRRRAGLGRRLGRPDPERDPDRPGLHAPGAPRPRLCDRAHSRALAATARRGPAFLLPLHRPRKPDVEQDLRANRLRAGSRVGDGGLRR